MDDGLGLSLASLPCRNPLAKFTAPHRFDPYWTGIWDTHHSAVWVGRRDVELTRHARLVRPVRHEIRFPDDEARRMLIQRPDVLRALGVTGMWRTATSQQIAAFTGEVFGKLSDDILFSAGLLARGRLLTGISGLRLPLLYRTAWTSPLGDIETQVTYQQWLALTAGVPWRNGPQADRHNILASELGLRCAEYGGWPCVLGESMAQFNQMFGNDQVPAGRNWAGDLLLVRSDGLRVVVEVSASAGVPFAEKAERWAQFLANDQSKATMVVFVDARRPDRAHDRLGQVIHRSMKKSISRAAFKSMDRVRAGVDERMAIVRWDDWFPAPHHCTPEFLTFDVQRPTGPGDNRWEWASATDPFDVAGPKDPATAKAIIGNARLLYGLPHWLSDGPKPDVEHWLLRNSGFDTPPVAPHVRRGRSELRRYRRERFGSYAERVDAQQQRHDR